MDKTFTTLLVSISLLLKGLAAVLATNGLGDSAAFHWINIAAGSTVMIGSLVLDVWNAYCLWRRGRAVGTQAGINMTVAGGAVDSEGNVVSEFSPQATTPPKPVTLASADAIIKQYGPSDPTSIKKT